MTNILKADISQALGQAFIDDVFLQKSRYYYTLGRSHPWSAEPTPDQIADSDRYQQMVRTDILYAKQISGTSVSFIVPRYTYTPNTLYTKYDDAISMEGKKFYVISSDYNVYKCLDTDGNLSTVEPYGTSANPINLSDGYTWQYIYTVPPSLRTKFLTDNYMPVFNAITERYYSRGSIISVRINSGGSGYTQTSTQLVVTGDGYLANDPVKINSLVLSSHGAGYTSAPLVETQDQVQSYTTYTANSPIIKGQRVKVSDVAGVRFYEASSPGITGSSAPTHYYTTELNGSVQLKHIGTKPKITASVQATAVGKIVVTDGGFGYSATPSVSKSSPGTGCTLAAAVSGDVVADITVLTNGSGYTNASVTIESPFPSATSFTTSTSVPLGTILSATVSGSVYFYRVDSAGTTGTTTPTHTNGTASSGTCMLAVVGRQATAVAVLGIISGVTKYFDVQDVKILNSGSGYVQGSTTVTFSGGSPSIPATANAVVVAGKVVSINVTFPGYGYTSAPTVQINGVGTSATATANMQSGYGYSLAPQLIFSAPNNPAGTTPYAFTTVVKTEAKLEPVIIDGILRGISVVDGGVGYTQANIQVIGDGTGAAVTPIFASSELNTVQAQTELLATAGTISSVTIDDQGSNITSLAITLEGDGTGAAVTPYVDNNKLIRLTVTNPGQDYTYLNINIATNVGATPPVARAVLAPARGHGSNPIKELHANSIGLNVAIGDEVNNGFAFNNKFRQISILKSPLLVDQPKLLELPTASACVVVNTVVGATPLSANAIVTKNTTKYRVADFTPTQLLLQPMTTNTLAVGDTLSFSLNNISYSLQVNGIVAPEFDKYSGEILYVDNQNPFAPSTNQTINVTTTISLI